MSSVALVPERSGDFDQMLSENRANGWKDIPAQTKVIVHELLATSNIKEAASKAGVSVARAVQALRHGLVDEYFNECAKDYREVSVLNRTFVELEMIETLGQVNGDVEIYKLNRDGEQVSGKEFNGSAKIALLKEMRAMAGIKDGTGVGAVNINFDMSAFIGDDTDAKEVSKGITINGECNSTE